MSTDVDAAVRAHLTEVRERIDAAARRAGRDPREVELIAVSKRQPVERIAAAVRAGVTQLGENYVQEARDKRARLEALLGEGVTAPRWHMIGNLQRNKAGLAASLFDAVDTIDRASLAQALDRRAAELGRHLDALIQVNVSGEAQKSGTHPDEVPALLEACTGLTSLRVTGLMTVPAESPDPSANRAAFAQLRALRDRLRGQTGGDHLAELSMGMSADFEVAIEEGATAVRIGTAVFGPRLEHVDGN